MKTQKEINALVDMAIDDYNRKLEDSIANVRLRTCNARVIETKSYFVLRSYSTIVALIDKETGICYDFLRYVYGFTSTSAQHISKFWHDYGNGTVYTWRYVKE